MTDVQPFVYDTLSAREIRLLTPDTSVSESGLHWTITKVNIDDLSHRFIALSYAWATLELPTMFPINCNGRQLWVHQNLYTALPFLARRVGAERPLAAAYWIDAICINQEDDVEKVSQIRLMSTIYQRAKKVLVWLGLALKPEWQELIPQAIRLLPLLVEEYERTQALGWMLGTGVVDVDRRLSHLGRDGWEAILHLLRNDYFHRVWIVQELALAEAITFLCGDCEIDPSLMEKVLHRSFLVRHWAIFDRDTLERMRIQKDFHLDTVVFTIREVVKYSGDEGNAHQTIRIANLLADQVCFTPQDRVLGILGMVEQEFGDASQVLHDYRSIPELYTQFSTLLFKASGLTKVHWWYYLSMAFNKTRIGGLPSWVPDLHNNDTSSKRQPRESMLQFRTNVHPPWQASSGKRHAALGRRSGEIVLRGKLLDVVNVVHPEVPFFSTIVPPGLTSGLTWIAALVSLIIWESNLADAVLFCAPVEHRISEDTYLRTLFAGIYQDIASTTAQSIREIWLRFRDEGQKFLRLAPRLEELGRNIETNPCDLPDWTESDEEKVTVNNFRHDVEDPVCRFMISLTFTRDRQMINTRDGRFGFTCTGVQPGDVVCVFNDSVSPYVLRRAEHKDGDVRYKFVGDAYIHGLMYGEADGMNVAEEDILLV
ncbi:hypothetical protein E8E13_010270 [Curvularia kusanoi]|uniref:Heterokaryon incompatibility domain-containing protein n=1 Tax=Curvularia kusanoi TaxID=90978 RepID=A0A9P4TMU4_CURKU|nr:hypothetical protein E8E13_010270 [Curvularia kusanoi]